MPAEPSGGRALPDPALLERILAEEDIEGRVDDGLTDRLTALGRYLWERLRGAAPEVGIDPVLLFWLFEGVAALLALAVLGFGLWQLRRWLVGRRHRQAAAAAPLSLAVVPLALPADPDDALLRAFASGDLRAALRALWVGLALTLEQRGLGRFGPEVTNREFVASVRQAQPHWSGLSALQGLARSVDRLLYGEAAPELAEVRGLAEVARGLRSP